MTFITWKRAGGSPTDKAVARVQRYLWTEVVLVFHLSPAFAAAMARGYGGF